ncbi:MAG: glycosyltransferase family 2 protein, partial [Candidatus Kapaibacteriota bacterium]
MKKFDIAVAYRIYPGIGKPLAIYNNDKFKLVKLAFNSFLNALGGVNVSLYLILDSCPSIYKEMLLSFFQKAKVIEVSQAGNSKTFEIQMELLLEQQDSNLVYFAEDDYFYLPNAFETTLDFFLQNSPNFLTLYYHPDYLNWEVHNLGKHNKIYSNNQQWEQVGSTTLTFLTTKATLSKAKKVFSTFSKKNYDASIWFALTKLGIATPKFYSLPLTSNKGAFYFKLLAKMWYYSWWQIIFGEKYTLFAPNPSLATHLERDSLAPNV